MNSTLVKSESQITDALVPLDLAGSGCDYQENGSDYQENRARHTAEVWIVSRDPLSSGFCHVTMCPPGVYFIPDGVTLARTFDRERSVTLWKEWANTASSVHCSQAAETDLNC